PPQTPPPFPTRRSSDLPTTGPGTGGSQFEIRVIDASGNLINNGEQYNFSLPASCLPNGCTPAYTPISFTTSAGGTTPPPPPPPPDRKSTRLNSSHVKNS